MRNDMPDDMLKDAIETSRRILDSVTDFDSDGEYLLSSYIFLFKCYSSTY